MTRVSGRRLALALFAVSSLPVPAAHAAEEPALRLEPCSEAPLETALCGSLPVPEAEAGGRTIPLKVVVIPALEPDASMVPLFHLEGGPGVAASGAAGFYKGTAGREYRLRRPVVLVDRRGTGGSGALRCPTLAAQGPLEEMYELGAVRSCRAELERGADLTAYGSEAAASDLDRVRSALGYPRIDLWALSYGTQLAQVYLKRFPAHVRSAVLVGVAPLDLKAPLYHAAAAQRVLDLVFHDCQMDPGCSAAYPDLRSEWRRVLEQLDRQPVRVRSPRAGRDADTVVEIRRGPFAEGLRNLLTTTSAQRRIPFVVHRAAAGDFAPFLAMLPHGPSAVAEGLYLSATCTEGTARVQPGEIAGLTAGTFLGDYRLRRQQAACAEWPRYAVPEDFFVAPATRVPVLVVSGAMDHVTPPRFAEELCGALPGCRLLSVPGLGHAPFDLNNWQGGDCLDRLMNAFYARPDPAALDASCVYRMRPPAFKLPPSP